MGEHISRVLPTSSERNVSSFLSAHSPVIGSNVTDRQTDRERDGYS